MVNRGGYRITDDDARWLENIRTPPKVIEHVCGNCRTPYGRSSVPCRNDPAAQR